MTVGVADITAVSVDRSGPFLSTGIPECVTLVGRSASRQKSDGFGSRGTGGQRGPASGCSRRQVGVPPKRTRSFASGKGSAFGVEGDTIPRRRRLAGRKERSQHSDAAGRARIGRGGSDQLKGAAIREKAGRADTYRFIRTPRGYR